MFDPLERLPIAIAPEAEKVVGLHPGALRQYERHVGDLEGVFATGISPDTEDAANRIRRLIARVTVTPTQPGFALRLEGRLSELMEAPNLYPNMRVRAPGGSVVAEVRSGQMPTVQLARVRI